MRSLKGVSRCGNKWRAQIFKDYKTIHLGVFESRDKAAKFYVDQYSNALLGRMIERSLRPVRTCSLCDSKHHAKGFCSKHYQMKIKRKSK